MKKNKSPEIFKKSNFKIFFKTKINFKINIYWQ